MALLPDVDLTWLEGRWNPRRSVAELHIPTEWRLWRAYDCALLEHDGEEGDDDSWRGWFTFHDPMDEEDLDEAAAFPLLKPDIDIFGPPCQYTRKERGWYYVKPWPPWPPSSEETHYATAANIPPELFQRILRCICGKGGKRGMASCGRVCRYWADQCRPRLFEELSLRSRQDALDLCAFWSDPDSHVFLDSTRHLGTVEEYKLSEFPWIHLIAPIWDGQPFTLELTGPVPASMKTIRSIHYAIPRSLPRSCSRKISELSLTDVCLRRFEDLVHLAGELPDLATLRCTRVTWNAPPTQLPRHPRTADRNRLHKWKLRECGPLWCSAAFFLLRSMYTQVSFFAEDDLRGMSVLLQWLDLHIEALCSDGSCTIDDGDDIVVSDRPGFARLYIKYFLKSQKESEDETKGRVTLRAELRSVPGGSTSLRITTICIQDPPHEVPPDHWSKLDTAADEFSSLRMGIFGFGDRESMLRFEQDVVQVQMPLLSGRHLIKYAVEMDDGWYQASCESDELEDSFGCGDPYEAYA